MQLFIVCLLTILLEAPIIYSFVKKQKYLLLVIVCVNVLTNLPLNVLLQLNILSFDYILYAEVAVVLIEMVLYQLVYPKGYTFWLKISFLANCFSYLVGRVLL